MEIVVPEEFKHLYVQNSKRPVVKIPAPVLRQKAVPIDRIATKHLKLIDEMIRVMKLANGVGIAAPQLGSGLRIVVVAPDGKPIPLINPVVVEASEETEIGEEGCLSIPGLYGDVERPAQVVIEAYDRKGNPVAYEMAGMGARVALHEIDHLDGILFIDKVDESTLHWQDPDKARDPAE